MEKHYFVLNTWQEIKDSDVTVLETSSTFLFLPVCFEGFSVGSLSVNFPMEAVDFLANARAFPR